VVATGFRFEDLLENELQNQRCPTRKRIVRIVWSEVALQQWEQQRLVLVLVRQSVRQMVQRRLGLLSKEELQQEHSLA
jgi:hypothetical protein